MSQNYALLAKQIAAQQEERARAAWAKYHVDRMNANPAPAILTPDDLMCRKRGGR